jgi:hypothetical protein
MGFSAKPVNKIRNERWPVRTFVHIDRTLIRKTISCFKIVPTMRRSSFIDMDHARLRPMDEWPAPNMIVGSAQTKRPAAGNVRSERSPLHDVRQHAQAYIPRTGHGSLTRICFSYGRDWRLAAAHLRLSFGGQPSRSAGLPAEAPKERRLVEPDGIEPTTSCLQSRRSPN